MKPNKMRNVVVGTVNKSIATRSRMWLSRKICHLCDGGVPRLPGLLIRHTGTCERNERQRRKCFVCKPCGVFRLDKISLSA